MCRMMAFFGKNMNSIPSEYLTKFVQMCHYGNWKRGDFTGHHAMGFGVAWLDQDTRIHVKRSIMPIWKTKWEDLLKIRSRCIVLHARKCPPQSIKFQDVHPITIDKKTFMFHNGTIDKKSFPNLRDPYLNKISKTTSMDTRKYLATYLDLMNQPSFAGNIPKIFSNLNKDITLKSSANSFILNRNKLLIVELMRQHSVFKTLKYILNIKKMDTKNYCISVAPFDDDFMPIPNKTTLEYDFDSEKLKISKIH
ncbi:MAG: hypothetical protein GF364_09990 [Candidatus Lokiarchaeota archaeon]|nr:hypothetical protein [Candidatus Lokiarchaeota archaeon]